MRLSTSLHRGILETSVGRVLNRFEIMSRRDTLFFEDILANYVKECEKEGYGAEICTAAQKAFAILIHGLVPQTLKKSPSIFLNVFAKNIWKNIGLLDDLKVTIDGDIIKIETMNECITRIIGQNKYAIGGFTGILNILFNSQVDLINASQMGEYSRYTFRLQDEPFEIIEAKDKAIYNKLNHMERTEGFTLKDAIKDNFFQLKKNKIYFRGKLLWHVENTFFHIIGSQNTLLDAVPEISYDYFSSIIGEDVAKDRKLILLKTLLQTLDWGIVRIAAKEGDDILLEIKNPPYGLQLEKDNWNFIYNTILGYLWTIDKRYKIKKVDESYKRLIMFFEL